MKLSIKLAIEGGMPAAKPLTREEKIAKLLEKIKYAGDCIECGHRKEQAIEFLQNLYNKLQSVPRLTDETQALMEECYKRVRDYGIKPLPPKEE
jgi:hypothetical protein